MFQIKMIAMMLNQISSQAKKHATHPDSELIPEVIRPAKIQGFMMLLPLAVTTQTSAKTEM
ncbi:MAG: hypothetical protein A3D92_12010 [Bacteroidetes bacterium RIFCSPHIGHO2_02_FULL_44_7]|nr:MAG: hypothetical protein A3D92_12010 [Bacteroidetes bacterium RIFCSPHIGHO2_02_FULL_44_7]